MLTTHSRELAERVRTMSLHGLSRQAWGRYNAGSTWRYDIVAPGYKYNLTDIAAALGLVQLNRAEEMRSRRSDITAQYNEAFAHLPVTLPNVPDEVTSAWHLYILRARSEEERDGLIASLNAEGIGTSVHFIPLHLHSYYRDTYGVEETDFPVATREFKRALSLPLYSSMSSAEVDRVIDSVTRAVGGGAAW